jgi:hypothetical protein
MFDFSEIQMEQLVIHRVGNKMREEGLGISPDVCAITDGNVEELLLKYFLSSFREKILYKFFHETDIHLNELYMYTSSIFINRQTLVEQSVNMLKHLYEKSTHPQIKGGEFYVAYFSGCTVNEQKVDAIGLFKTEKKENYLKVTKSRNEFIIDADKGINIRKLDKGCIVFNIESVDGYRVATVDNVNKGNNEAMYWKEDFLRLTDVQDEYFHTNHYLHLCQDFTENTYGPVYQADKKDQVVFMNEAIAYFANNEQFEAADFIQQVVREPERIEQFREHQQQYEQNQGLTAVEAFPISGQAVKTIKRKFRNLIKLDTDIEIKVKSPTAENSELGFIERGYDEAKGMHFYKVFFNEEE